MKSWVKLVPPGSGNTHHSAASMSSGTLSVKHKPVEICNEIISTKYNNVITRPTFYQTFLSRSQAFIPFYAMAASTVLRISP